MLSVKPGAKELLLDKDGNRVKIAGADCLKLPLGLAIKGSYRAIVDYIEALRKEGPSLIGIEGLKVAKTELKNELAADINFLIYLRTKKNE